MTRKPGPTAAKGGAPKKSISGGAVPAKKAPRPPAVLATTKVPPAPSPAPRSKSEGSTPGPISGALVIGPDGRIAIKEGDEFFYLEDIVPAGPSELQLGFQLFPTVRTVRVYEETELLSTLQGFLNGFASVGIQGSITTGRPPPPPPPPPPPRPGPFEKPAPAPERKKRSDR